jgi:hypothetical protein
VILECHHARSRVAVGGLEASSSRCDLCQKLVAKLWSKTCRRAGRSPIRRRRSAVPTPLNHHSLQVV